jgi:hypothetical protein
MDLAPKEQARVSIALVGRASLAKELDDLLLEWFDAQHMRVDIRRQPSLERSEVLAATADRQTLRVWMVLVGESVRLYYADPSGERFLVRDIPLRNGLDEVGREHVVQVLVTSAEDFVNRRVSSTQQEVEMGLPPPPVQQAAARPVAALAAPPVKTTPATGCGPRIGASYAVTLRGDEGMGHGPGAILGMGCATSRFSWALSMTAHYGWPAEAKGDDVTLSVRTFAARGTVAVETPDPRPFSVGVEIGGGVDRAAFEPRTRPGAAVVAHGAGADLRPVALVAARGSLWHGQGRLTFAMGINVPLVKTHYDVAIGTERHAEVTPWPVQPTFTLEGSWR